MRHTAREHNFLGLGRGGGQRETAYKYHQEVISGAVTPEQASRLLGSYLKCSGIHLPPDPSVRELDGLARRFWEAVNTNADQVYHDRKISEKTAWKAVRLFFDPTPQGWVRAPRPHIFSPAEAPTTYIGDTGDLTDLGLFLEYTYLDANGNLQIRKFPSNDPPRVFWSQRTRSLYVFPGAYVGPCEPVDTSAPEAVMAERWLQRPPACSRVVDVPEVNVTYAGQCDTLVYRSDKFHDRNPDPVQTGSQEYIHQSGDGVGVWHGPGRVPAAIVITGGCQDVEERGIIH